MPGIATHHVFGMELHRQLAGVVGESDSCRQAFLLGNLGPDPFFFLAVSPAHQRFRRLGSRMHAEEPSGLLDAVHAKLVAPDKECANKAARAYGLGFLCHYLLDSAVHPLVYAQQFAIANGGVRELDFDGPWLHRSVHATIETEIDEYVLSAHLNTNVVDYKPHKQMLLCPQDALKAVSEQMAGALQQAYDLRVPPSLFATAVEMNRVGQRLLDSKSGGLRGRVDFFPRVNVAVPYARALSPAAASRSATAFANDDHVPWPHPYELGTVMDASFDELYEQTFRKTLIAVPRFAEPGFGLHECRELTAGVNFLGKRV
jgi:hypothetical protein